MRRIVPQERMAIGSGLRVCVPHDRMRGAQATRIVIVLAMRGVPAI